MCELLKTRRSIRKYRPEQVPDELLDAVLEAGLYAPSAMNNQKPVMVAVRDKATRDQLSAMNAAVSRHLSVLKDADLIWDTREGKFIFYELNTSVLEEIMLWLTDLKGGAAP